MATTEHIRLGEQTQLHRREFDAPAAAVQLLHTDAERFVRWMGPRGTTVRLDRFDVRTGGAFRYVVESPDGGAWAFRGAYHEVVPGHVVHTWQYEDEPDVSLETLDFRDLDDGRSVLEIRSTHSSKEACDRMEASDMNGGMDEDHDRMAELLAALLAPDLEAGD